MFYPIENGSTVEIPDNCFWFTFVCQLPPIGYGKNIINGKIQQTDILKRSDIPEEQFWERPKLPDDYKKRRESEAARQKIDKDYYDPYLEDIRRREWKRVLLGVWFWNYNPQTQKSELQYITGTHYFKLTHWQFKKNFFFDFRISDRNFWYVMRYCEEDPNCLGLNDIEKRKGGKTARSGVWLYYRTFTKENQHGTIQSKSDDDAADVFKKAVVHPWRLLPHFFRPTYDLMKGDDPSETLNFFNTSRRGATAETEQTEEAINSFIDFFAAQEHSLDGPEIDSLVADEAGKTKKPVDIKERQNIVRYCSEIDGKFEHRRQLYTTTVEPDKNEPENYEFQEMTAQSNPMKRDDNGRTGTGLYTYFVPAQISMFADKYGYPNVEGAVVFLLNTRRKYEEDGDTRALSSFKRKNPMNFKEAFSADGEFALYDPERLNNQLDAISWNDQLTEKGNLEWEGGIPFKLEVDVNGVMQTKLNKIIWVPMENGRWEKIKGWWPKDANKVHENNGKFLPNNNFAFRIGCDPFKYDNTKDKRRSKCAAFVYQMSDPLAKDDICNDAFCLRYSFRRESKKLSNEDILKMCWLCGCQVLFERNVDHWKEHFKEWNCEGFLMYLPGELEPGIYTDGAGSTTQLICNYTESYINEHCEKVLFKTLLRKDTGWLGFKVEDTQTYDEPMGAGITLIAVKGKRYSRPQNHYKNVEDIMPLRKAV